MVDNTRKAYWKSLAQRDDGTIPLPVAGSEFQEVPESGGRGLTRRDFLAAAGFTFGSVALTGCNRAPVERAIPYLIQPEAIIPGRATYYASTCGACSAGCGMLVKNRDGRAIKLEGNPDHPDSRGGLCAVGQASVLGPYDSKRLQAPLLKSASAKWDAVDGEIVARLEAIRRDGGTVRFLSGPVTSPTMSRMIDSFLGTFADARHVTYETLSMSAIHRAHERTHGARVLPRYAFDKAEVIVGFDADFLGTWVSPVSFAAGWSAGRNADAPRFSYHVQFEGRMSVTGAKADRRIRIAPGELGLAMTHLASMLAHRAGAPFDSGSPAACPIDAHLLEELADRLWHARGKCLVACGSQDVDEQVLCNFINHLLGSYGATIDVQHPASPVENRYHNDDAVQDLLRELASGTVDALFIHGVNPVYDLPNGADLAQTLPKVETVVSFSDRVDETSRHATYNCPDHHYLESWGDADAGDGTIAFRQPTMLPLFDTRSVLESLSIWSGRKQAAQAIVRETWASRGLKPAARRGATHGTLPSTMVLQWCAPTRSASARSDRSRSSPFEPHSPCRMASSRSYSIRKPPCSTGAARPTRGCMRCPIQYRRLFGTITPAFRSRRLRSLVWPPATSSASTPATPRASSYPFSFNRVSTIRSSPSRSVTAGRRALASPTSVLNGSSEDRSWATTAWWERTPHRY